MGSLDGAPQFLNALPKPFQRQIARQCDGDWTRLTLDSDGGITVHNTPQRQYEEVVKPPAAAPKRKPRPEPRRQPPPAAPTWAFPQRDESEEHHDPGPPPVRLWEVPPEERVAKTARVDTAAFTRTELPVAGPPQKRAAKQAAAKKRSPRSVTEDPAAMQRLADLLGVDVQALKAVKADPPEPASAPVPTPAALAGRRPALTARPPLNKRHRRSEHPQGPPTQPRSAPPGPALFSAPAQPHPPQPKPVPSAPGTAMELESRLAEIACTLEITSAGMALVRFRGWPLAEVHTSQATGSAQIVADYRTILEQVARMVAGSQRAIDARDEAQRRLVALTRP